MEAEKPKRSMADLVADATNSAKVEAEKAGTNAAQQIMDAHFPKPYIPPKAPEPIHMRLAHIRSQTTDDLMKWLTTEAEHPNRPLDDGTKMAITAELMRRHTKPHAPSFVLLVVSVVIALASLGYSIWQGQQTKPSPSDSAAGQQTTPPAASAAR